MRNRMNIYAIKGHKVKLETLTAGYDSEKETVKELLNFDTEYTIERTNVYSWSTTVYLQEFPNVAFNSVFFKDAVEQSREDNKMHPDYSRYN